VTPDYLHRLAVAVAAVTYPGYRFWACGDHLHLAGAHVDVTTGERREMLWRRAWPGDVLAAADTGADTLPVLVAELVFAELAREHAHEIAEWLRWGGAHVVDPHPGGEQSAGDGVGTARITVRFGSGRVR
jgi:hypothetical protein